MHHVKKGQLSTFKTNLVGTKNYYIMEIQAMHTLSKSLWTVNYNYHRFVIDEIKT